MLMWIEEYVTNLNILIDPKIAGVYLEPGSKAIMQERTYLFLNIARDKRKAKRMSWEFSITREDPLTFKANDDRLQVDIAGKINGENDVVKEVNTLLRVWSFDQDLCYRDGIDGDEVKKKFDEKKKRVIVRYHFDRRAPTLKQPEPIYHLQVGGQALDDENCWFPKQVKVPRFHFPPMDVILLCELVLVNFFHNESENLRKKPEWIRLIQKSQHAFQNSYYDSFYSCLNDVNNTILGHLVSEVGS